MLRVVQKERILAMLRPEDVPFKILILDSSTQDIISPLMKLSDLRSCGVTAHFMLGSTRSPIKDIPAIYLVSAAAPFIEDVLQDRYFSYYLNVSTFISRNALETLAQDTSEKQMAQKVVSVVDQFISFGALEEDLFTLNITDSYIRREDPEAMRMACLGMFSIFVSINELPFIVGDGGELGLMLYQRIKNTKILKPTVKKPLLIILDRDFDFVTPTRHGMSYSELIHDTLGIKNNKVDVQEATGTASYDIDTDTEFYSKNRFLDFPTVADTVERELHEYKKELALRSITDKSDKAAVQKALESVPYLQKKSVIINSHLNICTKMLAEVKRRKLDDLYRMGLEFDRNEIMELSDQAEPLDLLRLCISLISTKNADLIEPILQKKRMSTDILQYFTAKQRTDGGFAQKVMSMLFKQTSPLCEKIEEILGLIRSKNYKKLDYHDLTGNGIFFSEVSSIFVYIHGGATYGELCAVKEIERKYKMPVILGGSEILNAEEYLRQIEEYIKQA